MIDFFEWARENKIDINSVDPQYDGENIDLKAIASTIGDDVQIVALSEGCHNNKEMMLLHHRIIKYLIENCGFTIVATETGLPESRLIFDYVQNQPVSDVESMYKKGLNKMYAEWQEGRDLIEWMRIYNQAHNNKLQYYGLDIGGFYQNWLNPMNQILRYLLDLVVDTEYANKLASKLEPFLAVMTENARINYNEKLDSLQRTQLAIILQEAVDVFDKNKEKYVSKSNQFEFEWARQSMISMQLAANYYENILDIQASKNPKFSGLNGREIAMHKNMMWISQVMAKAMATQKGQSPNEKVKIIWINHVIHTKTETQYQDNIWRFLTPAGQMIRESVGHDKVFIIGLVYGKGKFWKNWQKLAKRSIDVVPEPKKEGGIEPILSAVNKSNYFIHWEELLVKDGFSVPNVFLSLTFFMRENDYFIKIRPMEWNACIYLNEVNPATPLHVSKSQ